MTNIKLDGRALYQWDTDRHVIITPGDGEKVDEVHFASAGQKYALSVPCTMHDSFITAKIPNILLQSRAKIFVYIVVATDNGKHTECSANFSVSRRPKPVDYGNNETLETYGISAARIGNVNLLADKWKGENNLYSQIVEIDGVTENTQVDLTPSAEQLAIFYEKDLALVAENDGGVVTVYAIGQKPKNDYTIQATLTEVTA